MKKSRIITIILIIAIIIFAFYILNKKETVDPELAKCIGERSELYTQLGCTHCETQKKMFGDSFSFINETDCFYQKDLCTQKDIRVTPTWIIRGQKIEGVQKIQTLKELTNC